MYIANELKVVKPVEGLEEIRESFIENLFIVIEKFFADKNLLLK